MVVFFPESRGIYGLAIIRADYQLLKTVEIGFGRPLLSGGTVLTVLQQSFAGELGVKVNFNFKYFVCRNKITQQRECWNCWEVC